MRPVLVVGLSPVDCPQPAFPIERLARQVVIGHLQKQPPATLGSQPFARAIEHARGNCLATLFGQNAKRQKLRILAGGLNDHQPDRRAGPKGENAEGAGHGEQLRQGFRTPSLREASTVNGGSDREIEGFHGSQLDRSLRTHGTEISQRFC